MFFKPRVSDVLTTEAKRSHYHGKPWKWEGKCPHATPAPFAAHPLISPSRSALTVTRVLLPEINGHCAGTGVIESPACGAGSGEGSAFLLPLPSLAGGPGAKFSLAPAAAACGEAETSPLHIPASLRASLHPQSPGSRVGDRCRGVRDHWSYWAEEQHAHHRFGGPTGQLPG